MQIARIVAEWPEYFRTTSPDSCRGFGTFRPLCERVDIGGESLGNCQGDPLDEEPAAVIEGECWGETRGDVLRE